MDEIKAKQQIVEKIKESAKILVTVSDSPSVDALSAALALTMVLDKQEKYATAIFSGETPPAIAFLEPEKTFDDTTDSLRDFIIALNKEKADHLRYKVEGDAVKIFITPYKTTIDQNDLEFSQGDYNVELVIALGVDNQEHLDKALEEHGQILHDAAIITMTAGEQSSDLGGIDWHDANSSSLSEMVAGLAEALKVDKKKPLIDGPTATALLTGIVAQTDRFSNEHTTSKAMTVAATLMAAGADQQLIANELQAAQEAPEQPADDTDNTPNDSDNDSNNEVEVDKSSDDGTMTIKKNHDPSALSIKHEDETLADLDRRVMGVQKAKLKVAEEVAVVQSEAAEEEREKEAEKEAEEVTEPEATPDAPDEAPSEAPQLKAELESPAMGTAYKAEDDSIEPALGGTLNATSEQAAEDARHAAENDQNRTILSHSYLGGTDEPADGINAAAIPAMDTPEGFPGTPEVAPGSVGMNGGTAPVSEEVHSAYAPEDGTTVPSAGISGERVIQPLSDSTPAPASMPSASPYALPEEPVPSAAPPLNPTPVDLGLPLPPPLPDFSQMNTASGPAIPLPPTQPPAILGDILTQEAPAGPAATAPLPDPAPFNPTTNAVPAPNTAYAFEEPAPSIPPLGQDLPQPPQPQPPQTDSSDPTQFQIPPQQ